MKKCSYITFILAISTLTCWIQGCCTSTLLQNTSASLRQPVRNGPKEKNIVISATAACQAGTSDYKCNMKIHIQRDNMIWFAATHGLGIELARGKITPAGIEIINHMEKRYQVFDYHSLELNWKLPLNYKLIQAILLGELPDMGVDTKKSESLHHITIEQEQGFWKFLATIYKDTQDLARLTITNKITLNQGSIFYGYKKGCMQNFLFCDAKVYFTNFKLKLKYSKVAFPKQPLSFSFKIPAHYVHR